MLIPLAETAFLVTPVTKTSSIQKKPISAEALMTLVWTSEDQTLHTGKDLPTFFFSPLYIVENDW